MHTIVSCCPDPISGRFRYDPKDEIKTQRESRAMQPCKLCFSEPGIRGQAGMAGGREHEKERKQKKKGKKG